MYFLIAPLFSRFSSKASRAKCLFFFLLLLICYSNVNASIAFFGHLFTPVTCRKSYHSCTYCINILTIIAFNMTTAEYQRHNLFYYTLHSFKHDYRTLFLKKFHDSSWKKVLPVSVVKKN